MPDEATTAQAGTGTEALTSTSGTDTAATADRSTTTIDTTENQATEKVFTQADINRIVARETKKAVEAARHAAQQEAQQAELSEAQREKQRADALEAKAQEAEQRVQQIMMRNAVTLAVSDPKLQARDPAALAKLVDPDALSVDGDSVSGIEDELKRLRAAHPALFYSSTADGGARNSGGADVMPGFNRLQNAYANSTRRN